MFKKILVANRGEIAIRVLRTCREMGIATVGIYSTADRTAPHILMSDEAYPVGPPPAAESYLNIDRIMAVARQSGAEAIHPGYGFLSENIEFAQAIEANGLTWIGPPPAAIRELGDKTAARQRALQASVPVVPGLERPLTDSDDPQAIAREIGYPVLVKAAGGGGGKGMRIVARPADLAAGLERARSEAKSSFADDRIYIEKYLEDPHHIEVQILADQHGSCIALGERECSIQRRYQKIIEETPSPFIAPGLRQALLDQAVELARAADYVGAGTVEFLVDARHNFYFLEMNTRLQVEHPITEVVTGIDLVRQQIRIAWGEPLEFRQADLKFHGHAIECRIYAEDGFNNFTPSVGTIHELVLPDGFGVRLDHGLRMGEEVTPYYDPLLGKLIIHGSTREGAISGMRRALSEFHIVGVETVIPFCLAVMNNPNFIQGRYDTHFIQKEMDAIGRQVAVAAAGKRDVGAVAAALHHTLATDRPRPQNGVTTASNWKLQGRRQEQQ
ncbi:MAG: acetyl-CoA carboxylase biotin carboxylase subunit [Candidatus Neomarinimicrobiota bacterium]